MIRSDTKLNGKLTATITPSTGFTYSSNNVVKKGHMVMVYAKVSGTINSGKDNVIGTLPQEFRPETRCIFIASSDTTIFHERLAKITIMTNGEIRVLPGGIDLTGVHFSVSYISSGSL